MGAPALSTTVPQLDPFEETVLSGITQAFEELSKTHLRCLEHFRRKGRIGQGDYTALCTIYRPHQTLLIGVSVTRETYLKLIRASLPKEIAQDINPDNRDLLMSLMRRAFSLIDIELMKWKVDTDCTTQTMIEGPNHCLYTPSVVESDIIVGEAAFGPVYIEFCKYPTPESGLGLS
jgi:hypothetical protein